MKDWFKDWFASEFYLKVYSHRNDIDAKNLINLITQNIPLSENSYILDAACGNGRHAKQFAELGHKVIGFDLSLNLLKIAQYHSVNNLNFFCADIRNMYLKREFDLILNLFTSFGYFDTDDENSLFVKYASNHITQNGYFVLDYLNPIYVKDNLVTNSHKVVNNYNIEENRIIKNKRVEKEIIISSDDDLHRFYESVRLYSYNEIVNIFSRYGFRVLKTFGNYLGDKYIEKTSERMIFIFKK